MRLESDYKSMVVAVSPLIALMEDQVASYSDKINVLLLTVKLEWTQKLVSASVPIRWYFSVLKH